MRELTLELSVSAVVCRGDPGFSTRVPHETGPVRMLTLRFTGTVPYCVWRAHVGPSRVPVSGGPPTSRPDKPGIPTWALLSWSYTQPPHSHLQDPWDADFTGLQPAQCPTDHSADGRSKGNRT